MIDYTGPIMKIDKQPNDQINAELRATCLILETGIELIARERTGIRPEAIHRWWRSRDDQRFPKAEQFEINVN